METDLSYHPSSLASGPPVEGGALAGVGSSPPTASLIIILDEGVVWSSIVPVALESVRDGEHHQGDESKGDPRENGHYLNVYIG